MARIVPLIVAFAIVIVSGLAYGLYTDRWSPSDDLRHAAERVNNIPTTVGDWSMVQDRQATAVEQTLGNFQGFLSRRYQNRIKGDVVEFLIVCGRPKDIAAHTPEVCYGGSGFSPMGEEKKYPLKLDSGITDEFKMRKFHKAQEAVPTTLRILWSYSADGTWVGPDNPRTSFPRKKFLYKIYIVRHLLKADEVIDDNDPSVDFLKQMMPELQKALFPSSPEA